MICQKPVYGGIQKFVRETLTKFGVEVSYVQSGAVIKEITDQIRPNTRMIYVETPSNPDMGIIDLEELGKLSKENTNLLTVVDGTFASPHIQKPLRYGISISVHSCSKFIGGHTDIVAGCATFTTKELWSAVKQFQCSCGSYLSSFDASLMIRGLKTLPLRMERHSHNAYKLAQFLEEHPKVSRVLYPGLKSHPQYEIANRQMAGTGGMISFEMKSMEAARQLVEAVRLIILGVSLGGTESLIEHPATMTNSDMFMTDGQRKEGKISVGLIRFSVGLEDINDLMNDLRNALDQVED